MELTFRQSSLSLAWFYVLAFIGTLAVFAQICMPDYETVEQQALYKEKSPERMSTASSNNEIDSDEHIVLSGYFKTSSSTGAR